MNLIGYDLGRIKQLAEAVKADANSTPSAQLLAEVVLPIIGDLTEAESDAALTDVLEPKPEPLDILVKISKALFFDRIPSVTPWTKGSAQCNECGGNGCDTCGHRGWLPPDSPYVRRCEYDGCDNLIQPNCVAVYCSNECASYDA